MIRLNLDGKNWPIDGSLAFATIRRTVIPFTKQEQLTDLGSAFFFFLLHQTFLLLSQSLPEFYRESVSHFFILTILFLLTILFFEIWLIVQISYHDSRIKSTGAFEGSPHKGPNHIILNEVITIFISQHCAFFFSISLIYNSVPRMVSAASNSDSWSRNNGTSIREKIFFHSHLPLSDFVEDGPQYHPVVATLSLGSQAVFHYFQYQPESDDYGSPHFSWRRQEHQCIPFAILLLEPRSLIISRAPCTPHIFTGRSIRPQKEYIYIMVFFSSLESTMLKRTSSDQVQIIQLECRLRTCINCRTRRFFMQFKTKVLLCVC